jgi:DNA adenine methylase
MQEACRNDARALNKRKPLASVVALMSTPKPIVRWPGGKTRLLKHILPLIRPHRTYVEAFAGGLAVLLAKPPSAGEIVNDINGDLVNLYRYAQYHCDALVAEVQWTLNSREDLRDLVKQPGLTGLQRAARYLMRNRMSFGGAGENFAVSRQAQPSRENVLAALRSLSQRLDKVAVENLPYDRLTALYDGPETLWFLDPPYSAGATSHYGVWSEAEMTAFATLALSLQGDWIITVNDCPANRKLFAGHELVPIVTRAQCANQRTHSGKAFGELIIRRRQGRRSAAKAHSLALAA